MPLSVTRDGAEPAILSLTAVFDDLSPDIDIGDLIVRLGGQQPVSVMFKNGAYGTLALRSAHQDPLDQGALALLGERDFELECKLVFAVPVTAYCRAANKAQAQSIITDAFSKVRPPASKVSLTVDYERMVERFSALEKALGNHDLENLQPMGVQINRIEER